MLIKREILPKIYSFLKRKEFLAIIGPRQAGKTTLLGFIKEYLINTLKVDPRLIHELTFEDIALRARFEQGPVEFVMALTDEKALTFLLIDEYQYVKDGGQKLKLVYDTVPRLKVVLTGSSSLDLKFEVSKYMVGRLASFELMPLNFSEFLTGQAQIWARLTRDSRVWLRNFLANKLDQKEIQSLKKTEGESAGKLTAWLEQYCLYGGYPAVALETRIDIKQRLLRDIYNTFVLRDIKDLLALATDRELLKLSEHLAAQIGNIAVYKNLSAAAGLDFRALKKHLHILSETFIVKELRPWFRNRQKELIKNPKIYFLDSGLRNYLVNNFNVFNKRADLGAMLENFVYRHLLETFDVSGKLNFWRTKAGSEVDFVIERDGELLPIEVKYSELSRPQIPRGLKSFIDQYQPRQALVLTKNFQGQSDHAKCRVFFCPMYYL